MTGPLLGFGSARAQESATLSLAEITPATAALYAEILLDEEGDQLQRLDEILLRLGSEESLIEALTETDFSGSGDFDLTGAELALVVLPSALEGQDTGSIISDSLDGDTDQVMDDISNASSTTQGVALLVKPTDLDAAVATIDEQLVRDAGSESAVESETVDGVEIRSAALESGDMQAYAVVDDIIVVGAVVEDVTAFIGVDPADSLAQGESFNTASEALPAERVLFAFLNGGPFVEALSASEDANTQLAQDLISDLGNLDVDQGFALIADEPGLRVETIQIPRDGSADAESSGAVAGLTTADRVPDDTILFVNGFNLGQSALLEGTALLLVSALSGTLDGDVTPLDDGTPVGDEPVASPVVQDVDALYEAAAATLGVNLKTQFLDTLTGEYAFALWGVDLEDPTNIGAILTSDVNDVAALDGTVSFISLFVQAGAQGQASVTTRTVGDAEVNNVTFGDPSAPISVDYGVVEEELLIGVGDGLDQYLDGPAASLADNAVYQETLGYLPAEYDGIFYTDLAAVQALSSDLGAVTGALDMEDADEECAAYDTQEEAQAAYDDDPSANFTLDLDFDGDACEDFFVAGAAASPVATPAIGSTTDVPVQALAMVSFAEDGYARTSSILTLTEE